MKNIVFFLAFICLALPGFSQSKTTQDLETRFADVRKFFFYNNTLRMINQQENKDFDELIKDIEKMKLLLIRKNDPKFNYKELVSEYKRDSFEPAMTTRMEGKSFDVFFKEKNGKTLGMLVLVNDAENLYVLDIVGSIAFDKISSLYKVLNESSDIGSQIQRFANPEDKKKNEEKKSAQ